MFKHRPITSTLWGNPVRRAEPVFSGVEGSRCSGGLPGAGSVPVELGGDADPDSGNMHRFDDAA